MALTQEQLEKRDYKLTASRVACLMTGDRDEIINLWRELVGDPEYVSENLDNVWPVQLGIVTEELNLAWFARKHGVISRRGEVITHPSLDWAACTLDAWSDKFNCPVETKHCGGFEKLGDLIARYQPQMHWQMLVTDAKQCAFSVIQGAREPLVELVPLDKAYSGELLTRATKFMWHVKNLVPPVPLPVIKPPVKATKEYDMRSSNSWVAAAADWLENKMANKKYDTAEKTLKELVPDDSLRAFGGGVVVKRDRARRLKVVTESEE